MRRTLPITIILTLLSIAGCRGDDGPTRYQVSGTVTADGEPVKKGYIVFQPADPGGRADGAPIEAGRYDLRATPGRKKVEIRAMRTSGKIDANLGQPLEENFLPAKYNTKTELTAEVTASGPTRFDFSLSSR